MAPTTSRTASGYTDHLPLFALLGAVAVLGFFRVRSTDIFWHLASGRWIVEHGRIPGHDPFRFTSGGARWVDHEWLFQLLVHAVERLAGLDGLVVARVLLVVVLAGLLFRISRSSGLTVPGASIAALLSLFGTRPRLILRPELLTFVGVSLLLLILERRRRAASTLSEFLLAAAMLTVVWANVHGMAILAPVLCGLFLFGARFFPAKTVGPIGWRDVAVAPPLLLVATFANPYGVHILGVGAGIGEAMRDLPGVNAEWAPQWLAPQPFFIVGLAVLVAASLLAVRLRIRLDGATGLVALALAILAVTAVRHQALYFVGSLPYAARTFAGLGASEAVRGSARRLSLRPVSMVVCVLVTVWTLVPPSTGPLRPRQGAFTPGFGIEPGRFPEDAADWIDEHREIGRLFNVFAHGGYLLWRLYPPRQVFHDGRMELDPELLQRIGEARNDGRAWQQLMDLHGVDGAVLRYETRRRPVLEPDAGGRLRLVGTASESSLLFPRERFALVYWDDVAMVFVRRIPKRAVWLSRIEYAATDPEGFEETLARAARDPAFAERVRTELERRLREAPPSARAADLLAALDGDGR